MFVVSGLTKAREDECGIQLHTTEKQTIEQVSEIERSEACGIAAYITGLQNENHGKETGVCSTALLETVKTKRERKRLRLQLRKEKRRKRSEAVASVTIATLSTTTEAETNNRRKLNGKKERLTLMIHQKPEGRHLYQPGMTQIQRIRVVRSPIVLQVILLAKRRPRRQRLSPQTAYMNI